MAKTDSTNADRDFLTDQNSAADKKAARALARSLLKNLSAAQREEQSQKAAASFLQSSIYKDADCVAAYFSMPDEADTLPIIARAFLDKKRVLLPRVVPGSNAMDFYELAAPAFGFANNPSAAPAVLGLEAAAADMSNDSGLASEPRVLVLQSLLVQTEEGAWGIREPLATLPLISKKDFPARAAILVPGLAFAKDGRRLGRGKGFYDRYLTELRAANPAFAAQGKICGYCLTAQITATVPTQETDILMDAIFC